ncbi:MAG TPA: peptidase [Phenylobacterium sp.]|jgi:putative proteasome-type protease|uniref:peptidase n=1 Tax=Phenylobacterium sp. TaxID=1871053 RepID=UPI002B812935|nr:peptidase [Phenylobacterium sp.]HXA38434.1 peptidase [Phenylobacterium sp.]
MTYCLGILLPQGLVLASDSRSNAGVDQVVRVSKLNLMPTARDRVISIQSSGNLATTQAVVTRLHEAVGSGDPACDLGLARTMFEAAGIVGGQLRSKTEADAKFVEPYGDAAGSFLVGGQIAGEPPRLFQIYAAGNFVEASSRSPFLQIGETKYGKPILDRSLTPQCPLDEAAKLTLLSFDATIRSNLSVGLPIDLLVYRADSFAGNLVTIEEDDPYWNALRLAYSEGLAALVAGLPPPPSAWGV